MTTGHPLIALRDVTVAYGEGDSRVTALSALDLVVQEGESVALRGRSGSGKTTVLHAIRKIDKEVGENPRLKDEIDELKRQLSR